MNGRFGPEWNEPQEEQRGFRQHARNVFGQRIRAVGPDGRETELRRNVSQETILTDGQHGQAVQDIDHTSAVLDCGCLYTDKTDVKQTPGSRLVCAQHYNVCGRCQLVIEPVQGEGLYLPDFFDRAYHRRCAYETLDELIWQMRTDKSSIEIKPHILLTYQALHRQLRGEFPGPLRRFWRALVGG